MTRPSQRRFRPLRFVLRAGVAIDPLATLAAAANALPDPDACAWFDRELAAAQHEDRAPAGWLTLREAAALIDRDFDEAYFTLRNALDEQHCDPMSCVRRIGSWELVSADDVARFLEWAKPRGKRRDDVTVVSVARYADELAAECARRAGETALVDACAEQWAFSDAACLRTKARSS